MFNPWAALAGVAAIAVFYVLLPVVGDAFLRFRAKRRLRCPETGADAEVGVDAAHAALTAAFGRPQLRVKSCSLWLEGPDCGESCLHQPEVVSEAEHANSLTSPSAGAPSTRRWPSGSVRLPRRP